MFDYKNYFKGKKITVLGLGVLGRGVGDSKFLAQSGADLTITDFKDEEKLKVSLQKLKTFKNIKYTLGKHKLSDFKNKDLILKSAGVPFDSLYIKEAKKNKIPITMSSAFVAKHTKAIVIGVTGTRGKSTVTELIYHILKTAGKKVHKGGNIRGIATLPLLKKAKEGDYIVMELDSWQLQGFGYEKISPHISVFTTFYDDHLNYYKGSRKKYFLDKANVFKFQNKDDVLVISAQVKKELLKYYKTPINSKVVVSSKNKEIESWHTNLVGKHNQDNIIQGVCVAKALGLKDLVIKKAIKTFKPVEGRLEFVKKAGGVKIYNDNNATSPEATISAIRALESKSKNIILIMGGADKGLDMKALIKETKKCKSIILLAGSGSEKVENDFSKTQNVYKAENLKMAITTAIAFSERGDVVVFSPAFASFGMFKNEYDRNDQFLKIIKNLK